MESTCGLPPFGELTFSGSWRRFLIIRDHTEMISYSSYSNGSPSNSHKSPSYRTGLQAMETDVPKSQEQISKIQEQISKLKEQV
jgi:hypothetical protein